MTAPIYSADESARIAALKGYSILDTLEEKDYDEITSLASQICKTPISLVSLIDEKRQWFKSHHGLEVRETDRDISFCAHAINNKNENFIINDATLDDRFKDNPLVLEFPKVIFYAGVPLVDKDGFALGTLCVIDHKPNHLDEYQLNALQILANQLIKLLELRKKTATLASKLVEVEAQNVVLEQFARTAAHDISSPLHNIAGLSEILLNDYAQKLDQSGQDIVKFINFSSLKLTDLIQGILKYSKMTKILSLEKSEVKILDIVNQVIDLLGKNENVHYKLSISPKLQAHINKTALEQILINLISNGIKYNDKTSIIISISAKQVKDQLVFNVIDNGMGISESEKQNVFKMFETTSNIDKFGSKGNGIGLATVQTLVKGLGGKITFFSEKGNGTNFEFSLKY